MKEKRNTAPGEVFDLRRFWRYFRYDVINCASGQGISLLVIVLLPLFTLLARGILSVIFSEGHSWAFPSDQMRTTVLFVALVIVMFLFPSRLYGSLTEKKVGSAWLMVPASRLEKFLSMMLVSLVLLPATFIAGYGLSDLLAAAIDPGGSPILFGMDFYSMGGVGGIWLFWLSMVWTIVLFLLGAIVFKKWKIAKTFLCAFLISMAISGLLAFLASLSDWNGIMEAMVSADDLGQLGEETLFRLIRIVIWCASLVWVGLFGGLIAWRLHTMEH